MNARKLVLRTVVALCALVAAAALVAGPASAVESHVFSSSFGGTGSGAGEMSSPHGVAVNATTHDIYVADTGNARIDEFEADGTLVRAWGWGVADGLSQKLQSCTITCSAGLSGSGPGEFEAPTFIAVDNSAGSSKGDVYVGDTGDNLVTKFSESGALIESWGTHGQTASGELEEIAGIAVEGDGIPIAMSASSRLRRLAANGSVGEELAVERGTSANGLAVDAEGNFFKLNGSPNVEEITATDHDLGQVSTAEGTGIAVDPTTGGLYLDIGGEVDHYAFSSPGVVREAGGASCVVEPYKGCEATDAFGGSYLSDAKGLAVDASDEELYVANSGANEIDSFKQALLANATVTAASNLQPTTATLNGEVNPEGTATSYQFQYGISTAYGSNAPATPVSVGSDSTYHAVSAGVTGLLSDSEYHYRVAAINPNGTYYSRDETFETYGPPTLRNAAPGEVTRTQAKISAEVDPHGFDTHYLVEYGNTAAYGSSTASADIGSEAAYQGASVQITGLKLDTTYHYRVVASNSQGTVDGPDQTLTTLTAAPIEAESSSDVGSTTATVAARIDALGEPTSYRVEYGTSEGYGSSTPEASIGAPAEFVSVMTQLSGLQPATEYHFRFHASNGDGSGLGPDMTFKTAAAVAGTSSGLPDNRAYELVSPAAENQGVDSMDGGDHGVSSTSEDEGSPQPFRAATDGDAVAYPGKPALEAGSGAFGDSQSNEWIAERGTDGWAAHDITPTGTDSSAEYSLFSGDLLTGVFLADDAQPIAATPASPASCPVNAYARTSDGSYHALVAAPGSGPVSGCGEPAVVDVSQDGSHLLFEDEAALIAGAAAGARNQSPYTLSGGYNIYDSVGGVLHQVNILPDGQPEASPAAWIGSGIDTNLGSPDFENAVSANGSRVVWSSNELAPESGEGRYLPKALYVRENDAQPQSPIGPNGECTVASDACTVQVDKGEAQCVAEGKCTNGGGLYWTAGEDSTKVFFTACDRLTADSTAIGQSECVHQENGTESHRGEDLYEYDLASGRLTDLTVDPGEPLGADVQGVIGAGEAGAYVYFAARGLLTQGANAEGKEPVAGEVNLYVRHAGVTSFIATIDEESFTSLWEGPGPRDLARAPNNRTAEVAADGQSVVFETASPLTGYENLGCEGNSCPEVFVYDASSQRTACASCNPSGALPSERESPSVSLLPVTGGGGRHSEQHTQRWVSDDGSRVFFQTVQPLVPQDTNGRTDVYEWERNGSGSCPAVAAGATEQGCVYLISGGQSVDNSYFADADAEGNNVFFTSRADLAPQATDESVAMYDARVNGGFPELATACSGTGCQGVPPAPPIFATPSSVTYAGIGNFEPQSAAVRKATSTRSVKCRKGETRKGSKCVKKRKRTAGARKKTRKAKRSDKRSTRRRK